MEWYQARKCIVGFKRQDFMFGIKVSEYSNNTRLSMKQTSHTYSWSNFEHTWNYSKENVFLIHKGNT